VSVIHNETRFLDCERTTSKVISSCCLAHQGGTPYAVQLVFFVCIIYVYILCMCIYIIYYIYIRYLHIVICARAHAATAAVLPIALGGWLGLDLLGLHHARARVPPSAAVVVHLPALKRFLKFLTTLIQEKCVNARREHRG